MNHRPGPAFNALPFPDPSCGPMSDRNRSNPRRVDRFYLLAIIGYALLAAAFIGYFIWRVVVH